MKKSFGRAFTVLLAAALGLCAVIPAFAAEPQSAATVRIGYIDYEGFINAGADGTFSGYGVELLEKISEITGWQYEFVFDTFEDQLENLKTGEIDFVCHAQKTAQREKTFLFSKYSSGAESSVLYARTDDGRFYYNDDSSLSGITIGFLAGSFQNDEFVEFAAARGITYQSRYYDTQAQSFAALDSGEVDAVAMGSLGGVQGYKVIRLFGFDPFYFISGTGNGSLMAQLDDALGQILAADQTYLSSLYTKYYGSMAASSELLFTREESAYIASAGPIVVGLMKGRSPLSATDDSGNACGMLVDLLNLVGQKSGLTFEYRFMDVAQTGYSFLTESGGDLVAGVASSAFSTPNAALLQTESLLDASVVFVGRSGMEFSPTATLTVALPAGFINGEAILSALYPAFQYYSCTTNQECLAAIRDGQADVMLQNIYVIRECLQSPLYDNLEMFPAYEFTEAEKVVALPENAMLVSIINRAISCLSADEVNDVVINNTIGKTYHADLGEVIYKYRVPLIMVAVLLVAVFTLIITGWMSRQHSYRVIKAANGELENANLQLADAVKQADHANSAKSQFLARMSHEIRTPMNAIVGLTAIARTHLDDEERMADYLGKIDTSSHVLLNIINDVLDMSAIESEKLKIDESDFDLKQVLNGISTIYYTQCKNKGVTFTLGADLPREMLVGDSLRVNQILLNLVSNAYKFTPAGGSITVTAGEIEHRDNIDYIRFTVSDTGVGMSEDMMSRLFKPFEQESSKTAQQHGGSGLGLSITKNLVEMMNGAIRVESEKGKGTTFIVDIPFRISDKNPIMAAETVHDLTALVVDDEFFAQEYTGLILQRIGIPYTVASSGEEALQQLHQAGAEGKKYDVCFIDWKMPGMNGLELTRKIRESFGADTLVIIVSAYDVGEVEEEAKKAGADVFVTKPLFQSTVFNLLMQLSGGRYKKETGDPEAYDFTGHKVLLAEDNELNSEIAMELLDIVHMSCDHAADGKEVVERFNASAPGEYDLILMDIQMPNLDGYEATKAIRSGPHPQAATIPIIAMTANAFSSDISAALSAGMNGHVAKPIDTKLLYQTLAKYASDKK